MKKTIIIIGTIFLLIILYFLLFGLEIGNVTIGKQPAVKTRQEIQIKNSLFYNQYYSKNKLTVLNLWATWCQPCIEEMPDLNAIKKKYIAQDINFISMSVDNDSLRLAKFIEKGRFEFKDITFENLQYTNAIINRLEDRSLDTHISSKSVPITYLIRNERVLKKFYGTVDGDELVDAIEKFK